MSSEYDNQKRNENGIWGGKLTKEDKAIIAEGIAQRYEELAVDMQNMFPLDYSMVDYCLDKAKNVRDRHITNRERSSSVRVSDMEG